MDHALELGQEAPDRPIVFGKFPSSIVGPGDQITWAGDLSSQVDYEAELAFVVGKTAKNVREEDAFEHIVGAPSAAWCFL